MLAAFFPCGTLPLEFDEMRLGNFPSLLEVKASPSIADHHHVPTCQGIDGHTAPTVYYLLFRAVTEHMIWYPKTSDFFPCVRKQLQLPVIDHGHGNTLDCYRKAVFSHAILPSLVKVKIPKESYPSAKIASTLPEKSFFVKRKQAYASLFFLYTDSIGSPD